MHPEPRWYVCLNIDCRFVHIPRVVEARPIEGHNGMWEWPSPVCECSPEAAMRRHFGPLPTVVVADGSELLAILREDQQRVGGA